MTQRRAWKALIQTRTVTVGGQSFDFAKMGTPIIATIVANNPGVGDVVEIVMNDRAKGKATTIESLAAAAAAAAERETGSRESASGGRVARVFVAALPGLITDLITASAVVVDEAERAEFRDWFGSLPLTATIDALMAWVGLNLPEAAGPLGDLLARVSLMVEGLPTLVQEMTKSGASEPEPESELPAQALAA